MHWLRSDPRRTTRRRLLVALAAAAAMTAATAPATAHGAALRYSTYAGGPQWDEAYSVALDANGGAYVAGFTFSPAFPHVGAGRGLFRGVQDAVVQRYGADGKLVYSTVLGGSGTDVAQAIAVDRRGNAYVTGSTLSVDFPVRRALQPRPQGAHCQDQPCPEAFVTKLDGDGRIVYSTYFGGGGGEDGWGIAVDRAGSAYVTGNTSSPDLPTRRAFQPRNGSRPCDADVPCPPDVFVAKLGPSGDALRYSTYLGGTQSELSGGIAVDATGSAYVSGSTRSSNFPTRRAVQPAIHGRKCGPPPGKPCTDVFLTKLDRDGRSAVYSTYFGGTENERSAGVAVDRLGRAYLAGATASPDFPLRSPVQPALANQCSQTEPKELCDDGFVAGLSEDGRRLRFSTYLGGNADDGVLGIAVDRTGAVHVAGSTDSRVFRTAAPLQPQLGGAIDAFVAQLGPGGRSLVSSTYLGGSKNERFSAIAVDALGHPVLAGRSDSPNFPLAAPAQGALSGDIDAVVTRLR